MQIYIRKMTMADVPEVVNIERASFSTPWSETSFLSELEKESSVCLVATSKRLIVGYICALCILKEGHILTLGVRHGWRRMGIGKKLVLYVLNELSQLGCTNVFLEVRASNNAAKRLYESLGFRVVGLRRRYYAWPDEDAVVMELDLGEGKMYSQKV